MCYLCQMGTYPHIPLHKNLILSRRKTPGFTHGEMSRYIRKESDKVVLSLSLLFGAGAKLETNACPPKTKRLAQAVLQVTFVREVHDFWVVDKKDEGRWIYSRLGRVINLERSTMYDRGHVATYGILYNFVQASSGDTQEAHLRDIQHRFQQRLHMIARFSGGEDNRSIGNELQSFCNIFAVTLRALD